MKNMWMNTKVFLPAMIISFIGLASIILLWIGYSLTDENFRKYVVLVDGLKQARTDVTKAYLLAEKSWSGRESINKSGIVFLLENASQRTRECAAGRSRLSGITGAPLANEELIGSIEAYGQLIQSFKRLLERTLPGDGAEENRSLAVERGMFHELEVSADQMFVSINRDLSQSYESMRSIFGYTFILWVVLLILASGVMILLVKRREAQAARLIFQGYILENVNDAIIVTDNQWNISSWNEAAEKVYGWAQKDVQGLSLEGLLKPEYLEASRSDVEKRLSEKGMFFGEVFHIRQDGTKAVIETRISRIRHEENDSDVFVMINRDVSRRKVAEERLREQAELIDITEDAMMVRDLDERITFWNKGAERIYGWVSHEVLGKRSSELFVVDAFSPEYQKALRDIFEKGYWSGEGTHRRKDGKEITVESKWTMIYGEKGEPHAKLVVNRDVTQKKQLERQFFRSQRLESVGMLAGGIAHDLNNVLGPILLSIDILKRLNADDKALKMLDLIESSVARGRNIIQQVLTFARGSEGPNVVVNVKHLLKEIDDFIRSTFPKSIEHQFVMPKDPPNVEGDPTQLNQVFMNLAVNARDAMPEGGKLVLEVESQIVDEKAKTLVQDVPPGPYVVIRVSDTGTGMSKEVLEKIFDPFFTTKEIGKGTGLGLSTSLSIVRKHGGAITVYSEIGKGTTFSVYLPAKRRAEEKTEIRQGDLPAGNGELILLVEDETAIRAITEEILRTHNYHLLLASNGEEALKFFSEHQKEIRLVITDSMMPIMGGPRLIQNIHKMDRSVRVIVTSGLSSGSPEGLAAEFLQKPYTAEQLLKTIRRVIDGLLDLERTIL